MFLIISERPLAFYQSLHHCNYEIFQHMTLVRSTEAKLFYCFLAHTDRVSKLARAAFKHRDFCLGPRPYMSFAVGADGID
jgi:hypothetical protein